MSIITNITEFDENASLLVEGNGELGIFGTKQLHAADLINAVAECSDWVVHNLYFRGKCLGDKFTPEQLRAIREETFNGMLVGDYWAIKDSTGKVHNWRIVDINYWRCIWSLAKPHIVIMPDDILYESPYEYAQYNVSNMTTNGYVSSYVRTEGLNKAKEMIREAFDGHLISYGDQFSSKVNQTTGLVEASVYVGDANVELPTEIMIFGTNFLVPRTNPSLGATNPLYYNSNTAQFALMRLCPEFITVYPIRYYNNQSWYLLRDIYSQKRIGVVNTNGAADKWPCGQSYGVRPIAAIG